MARRTDQKSKKKSRLTGGEIAATDINLAEARNLTAGVNFVCTSVSNSTAGKIRRASAILLCKSGLRMSPYQRQPKQKDEQLSKLKPGHVVPKPDTVLPKTADPEPVEEKKVDRVMVLDYYYDDPHESGLHGPLVIPVFPKGTPEFTVVGWKGILDVVRGTPAYQAAQVWGAMATSLSYVMSLKNSPSYIKESWATTYNLVAIPRAGNQLNAYYDRSSLRFFWGKDPKTGKVIYTCDAVGIVSHEFGHAILDTMRPDLWNTCILEFFAFHEAFGDIIALATILQHDIVIEHMLKETTNSPNLPNLWQSNVVSRLARELGHAIYYSSAMVIGSEKYLRNAFNDFKYTDPSKLKLGNIDAELTQEPHNFSRIFSGAWYECFCELFKENYKNHDKVLAVEMVKQSRDTMVCALLDAVLEVPNQLQFFKAISATIINVLLYQGQEREASIVKKVFARRNLWHENDEFSKQTLINTGDLNLPVPHRLLAHIGATTTDKARSISVELPKWMFHNKDAGESHTALSASVASFLNYATDQKLLGNDGDNNMFTIDQDGMLSRNYICSSFRSPPAIAGKDNVGHIAR
jgi:hypothetical protein